MNTAKPIIPKSCPRTPGTIPGKSRSPQATIDWAKAAMERSGRKILRETRRIDTGRLDIPVFMSICASEMRDIIPTRKQMGKGPNPQQAEASAIMELAERHAFFSFWQTAENAPRITWKKARDIFGAALISEDEMLLSVNDNLDPKAAAEILNLFPWFFHSATNLSKNELMWLPLDWFRMLGEFNGSSAGNSATESLLQGICELVERHVCCLADLKRPVLPTLMVKNCPNSTLADLLERFERAGIKLILKDMTLGMPVPTVAALAWDPLTFPGTSEIVFTAGTASSPVEAAIRAITEVAQLGGDFHTSSRYEASGLPKFNSLDECAWLLNGPETELEKMPDLKHADMLDELNALLAGLSPIGVYAVETTDPGLKIPAHWTIAPGLQFRERDQAQSLGLFVGRKLAEDSSFQAGMEGLRKLEKYYNGSHFLPFFKGLAHFRNGQPNEALSFFNEALTINAHADACAMTNFYAGFTLTTQEKWQEALPFLSKAFEVCPQMAEYGNLAGVACYKLGNYAEAENFFDRVLGQNKGSAIDLANRGVCRKFMGRNAEARQDLEMALELDPSLDFARKHLAEI